MKEMQMRSDFGESQSEFNAAGDEEDRRALEVEQKIQDLYDKDWDHDIDSDDVVEKDLVVGYSLPTIETYHKLKLERAHKTKRMIDEIEEATSLEFEIRESIILQ